MDFKLNAEQQKIVADNIGLIYLVAREWYIDLEEYWGYLAEGLCAAAYYFDESRGVSFSHYACRCIENMYARAYNHDEKREKDWWKRLNMKPPLYFEGENEKVRENLDGEHLQSDLDLQCQPISNELEEVEISVLFSEFYNTLKEEDKNLIKLLATGLSISAIGKKLGVSRQAVSLRKIRLQNKFKYDLGMECLCRAAYYWDPEKGKLSTIFQEIFFQKIYEERSKDSMYNLYYKGGYQTCHLESTLCHLDDEDLTVQDILEEEEPGFETVRVLQLYKQFKSNQNTRDQELLSELEKGLTVGQIAKKQGISKQAISKRKMGLQYKFHMCYLKDNPVFKDKMTYGVY